MQLCSNHSMKFLIPFVTCTVFILSAFIGSTLSRSLLSAGYAPVKFDNGTTTSCKIVTDYKPCPPGTEIDEYCDYPGGPMKCKHCVQGFNQCAFVTSDFDLRCQPAGVTCPEFGLETMEKITWLESGECRTDCICNEEKGYTGKNPNDCQLQKACGKDTELQNGKCVACKEGYHNPSEYFGKCIKKSTDVTQRKSTLTTSTSRYMNVTMVTQVAEGDNSSLANEKPDIKTKSPGKPSDEGIAHSSNVAQWILVGVTSAIVIAVCIKAFTVLVNSDYTRIDNQNNGSESNDRGAETDRGAGNDRTAESDRGPESYRADVNDRGAESDRGADNHRTVEIDRDAVNDRADANDRGAVSDRTAESDRADVNNRGAVNDISAVSDRTDESDRADVIDRGAVNDRDAGNDIGPESDRAVRGAVNDRGNIVDKNVVLIHSKIDEQEAQTFIDCYNGKISKNIKIEMISCFSPTFGGSKVKKPREIIESCHFGLVLMTLNVYKCDDCQFVIEEALAESLIEKSSDKNFSLHLLNTEPRNYKNYAGFANIESFDIADQGFEKKLFDFLK